MYNFRNENVRIVTRDYQKCVDLTENEISSLWRLYGSEGEIADIKVPGII